MKLNLGSGNVRFEGFTNVDLYDSTADIKADICNVPLEDGIADEIKCIQVVEHVPYNKNEALFAEMYRLLAPGGFVDLETPDIDVVCYRILQDGLTDQWVHNLVGEYYRPHDKDRYEDWEHNLASIHRNPWNFERLERFASKPGFTIKRMPWQESIYNVEENMFVRLYK